MRIGRQEMADYYGMWAHLIKTPIAALHVLIQSTEESLDDSLLQSMKMELFKAEQYVEMVPSYLRTEEMSADLMLQVYETDNLVRQAVKKYSSMFILKKIHLDYQTTDSKFPLPYRCIWESRIS